MDQRVKHLTEVMASEVIDGLLGGQIDVVLEKPVPSPRSRVKSPEKPGPLDILSTLQFPPEKVRIHGYWIGEEVVLRCSFPRSEALEVC